MEFASDLLERSEQQRAIDAALRDARQGLGRVLVIEGNAGIGKSRLLQELRRTASPNQRVITARASELERGFAFGVVRQLFEGIVRDPELGPLATEGAAASARAIFEEVPGERAGASFAILHGLHWLALNLAEQQPLVLAIDDLHWCDASSLRFFAYLARRLEGTSILLATATRPVTPATVDAELVAELLADPSAMHLYPQALSEEGVAALLAAQLDQPADPAFVRACFGATDGNPLMLRQLARSLQAEGTTPTAANAASIRRAAHRALSRTVLARVGRYSSDAIAVARAVAVLGNSADLPLVAAFTGLEPAAITAAWTELVDAEILRRDVLAFVHALVRDAIYFDLPEPERETMHLQAARHLSALGGSMERIASQLELAPALGDPWVADIAEQAGDAATRRGAPDAAARHLRRALDEPPAPERRLIVMQKLAEALFDVDAPAALELLQAIAVQQDDPAERGATEIALVQAMALTDRWIEASALAREAHERLEGHPDLQAILETIRAVATMFGADDWPGLHAMEAYRDLAEGQSLGRRLRAGQAALWWTYDGGTSTECAALAERALGSDPTILRDHTLVAVAPLYVMGLADRDEGLDLWQRAREDAHRSGSVILKLTADMWLSFTLQRRGDLAEAITGLNDALGLMLRWGSGDEPKRYCCSSLALAYLDAGDNDRAREALSIAPPQPGNRSLGSLLWWHANAWAYFDAGDAEQALAATETLEQRSAWIASPIGIDFRIPRALAQHRLGDAAGAEATIQDALEIAERWGSPFVLGQALRVAGEIRGEDGLPDLRRSAELLDGSCAKVQFTRTLIAYGAALRRDRRPTEAREPLERALELGRACGSPGLEEAARTELAATGVRRRATELGGAGSLTPSERRVADLAAGGRTNREIAQALFVTPKTVEVHLSAAYRKLGIASRHALSGVLTGAA